MARRYRVTLPGGIPVKVGKNGSVADGIRALLDREGKQVFVRSDLPGFVTFTKREEGIQGWPYATAGHTLPALPGEYPWADELINLVKGSR